MFGPATNVVSLALISALLVVFEFKLVVVDACVAVELALDAELTLEVALLLVSALTVVAPPNSVAITTEEYTHILPDLYIL